MSVLQTILAAVADAMTPDGTLVRARARVTVDMLLTLLISVLAVGLAVGYQVMRHMPRSWREQLLGDDTQE